MKSLREAEGAVLDAVVEWASANTDDAITRAAATLRERQEALTRLQAGDAVPAPNPLRAAEQRVDLVASVHQFHEAFGVALGGSWGNEYRRRLRRALIREEFREYCDAEDADDPTATLDALVDLTYVIVGTALEYGWDFAGAFDAVHAANMAKLGSDGKPLLRDDGKVLKPEGWKPADLSPFVTPPEPRT